MSLSESKSQEREEAVGDDAVTTLARMKEQAAEFAKAIERIEKQVRMARGTGDVSAAAAEAQATVKPEPQIEEPPPPPKQDLRSRIATALTRESLDAYQLARAVGASVSKVSELLKTLKAEQAIYNVGLAENPKWTWRVGDAADSRVLRMVVERLISERPMTTRELANATGARMSRVGGQLVEIQRSGAEIINLGHGHVYRYFMISAHARPAKLQPKKPLGKTTRRTQGNG